MKEAENLVRTSKFLSLVLRHRPGMIGVTLDDAGWVDVEELLKGCEARGNRISRELLEEVVARNDKCRFSFSEDGRRIRANQGHTVDVDLGLPPVAPPELLYHGTAEQNLEPILRDGIHRGKRHHVHLSPDRETAITVGRRHGKPVVLVVQSGEMAREGFTFYCSENGVWLVDSVPTRFLSPTDH
jgi:putative RNA 2'-phosphotransferase